MGKFHYVNRKSEGLKLGHVIAKDLLKRIPPGPNHKAALRDPSIDLDVSGKALTDEGLKEVAEALIKSIMYEDGKGKVVKLEEACMKGNNITAKSLRLLGRVVASAAYDLRDLDLSNNSITINTQEDAAAWEDFLLSFTKNCVLRRVDFSGNTLGPKAFELLAKVFGQGSSKGHRPVTDSAMPSPRTPMTPGLAANGVEGLRQFASNLTISSDLDERLNGSGRPAEGGTNARQAHSQGLDLDSLNKSLTKAVTPTKGGAINAGLRSIPYLIFSDTGMNDTCALHLSYIIPPHQTPDQLLPRLPPAKAGLATQQLETYDAIPGCRGIIYKPNSELGSAGIRLLELAEVARGHTSDETAIRSPEVSLNPISSPPSSSRKSSTPNAATASILTPGRRRSAVTTTTAPTCPEELSILHGELHRARSRIQGDTLRDLGPQSNDLWHASLKMLSLARTLLVQPTRNPLRTSSYSTGEYGLGSPLPASVGRASLGLLRPKTPLGWADSNKPITLHLPERRKPSTIPPALATTALEPRSPAPRNPLPHSGVDPYRSTLPGGLSEGIWCWIIALAAGAMGVANEKQRVAIVKWAVERGTLGREMDTLGKAGSAQIWKVLEGMGCLAYEVRV